MAERVEIHHVSITIAGGTVDERAHLARSIIRRATKSAESFPGIRIDAGVEQDEVEDANKGTAFVTREANDG